MPRYFDGHGNDVTVYVEELEERGKTATVSVTIADAEEVKAKLEEAKETIEALTKRAEVAEGKLMALMAENSKLKKRLKVESPVH